MQKSTGTKAVGFGKHIWALGPSPDAKIHQFWFYAWISNILYAFSMVLVQISVLLFLRRAFQFSNLTKYGVILGVLVILWGVASVRLPTCT